MSNWFGFNKRKPVEKQDVLQQLQQASNSNYQNLSALAFQTGMFSYPQQYPQTLTGAQGISGPIGPTTTAGTGPWIINSPGTAGSGTYNNSIQSPTVVLPTPYGANKWLESMSQLPGPPQAGKRIVLIAVETFKHALDDTQFIEGDVVPALDTMVCFRRKSNSDQMLWEQVRIMPDGTVTPILQEVAIQPERKEVFDEFEKHLNPIPEREKNDSSFLQKAKSILLPKSNPDTPALT